MATKTRVVLVGIGGATCSGKTTLAKHLKRIIPDSVIIHQDDFAPPLELVPVHPVYNVQDWDAPAGAIEWPRLIAFLQRVKQTGEIPQDHYSHDHLNEQKDVPLSPEVEEHWRKTFNHLRDTTAENGEKTIFGLLDGFILYWHPDVISQLDVRIFLRVPHDTLKQRRQERHGYHTAEGVLWRDPPHYWEQIVYPAYVESLQGVFVDEDIESGTPTDKVNDLILVEPLKLSMDEIFNKVCSGILQHLPAVSDS